MTYRRINEEVYYLSGNRCDITSRDIEFLKEQAVFNPGKKCRLCLHTSVEDTVQEMVIALAEDIFVPPHLHRGKTESFHCIEGAMTVVVFSDSGGVETAVALGIYPGDGAFCFRIPQNRYHTVIPLTGVVVFKETTRGPFRREDLVIAPWASGASL